MISFPGAAVAALLVGLLAFGAVGAGAQTARSGTVDPDDPVDPGSRPPTLPMDLSSVATGGYWEEAARSGVLRVIVVNRGWEQVSSLVFLEWLEERVGEPSSRVAQIPVSEINDHAGWSVDTPILRPSETGLIVELSAVELGSYEQRRFQLFVPLQGVGRYKLE